MSKSVKRANPLHKVLFSLFIVSALVLTSLGGLTVARADNGLTLSTEFPGITVKAGETVNFEMSLTNDTELPLDAALSVASLPSGWEGYFEGNGSQVSRVHAASMNAEEPTELDFNLTVPEDATDGSYTVSLLADAGEGISDALELELTVSELQLAEGDFTSQYPALEGPSTATFSFSATLVNNSGTEKSYSLASNAPEGWQVSFRPSGETNQIASTTIDAGKNQGLDISVTPPASVVAGEYTIPCAAVSADETLAMDLTVNITGTYSIQLTTPSGLLSLDAYADRETPVTLSIENTGSADLQDISLASTLPENWAVRFETTTIESLAAGASQQVTAYVKPGPNVISGDYVTSLSASTTQASSSAEFRVSVKTHTTWGAVGIIIIVALVVVLILIFRKFGRR